MTPKRLLAAAACVLLAGCQISLSRPESAGGPRGPSLGEVTIEQAPSAPPPSDTAEMVSEVLPSVVNVEVRDVSGSRGQGSGVIIDESGIIVTNNHVVQNAVDVRVVFTDAAGHRPVDGEVIGTAPEKDLAVIRVDAGRLDPITVGSSERLRLGDEVVAIGFPLGLGGVTVTKGIVSGKNRNISVGDGPEALRLEGLLQTDAAINPGNSGGALVNSAGQLVGINTAAAQAGAAENLGFAIAIDSALPVIREIIEEPPARRAWLGVSIADVSSSAVAIQFGVDPSVRGAGIVEVFPDSPAQRAGIRAGEVIVGLDDTRISSANDLTEALSERNPGDTVTLTLVGPGGTREVEVELGRRPPTLGG